MEHLYQYYYYYLHPIRDPYPVLSKTQHHLYYNYSALFIGSFVLTGPLGPVLTSHSLGIRADWDRIPGTRKGGKVGRHMDDRAPLDGEW